MIESAEPSIAPISAPSSLGVQGDRSNVGGSKKAGRPERHREERDTSKQPDGKSNERQRKVEKQLREVVSVAPVDQPISTMLFSKIRSVPSQSDLDKFPKLVSELRQWTTEFSFLETAPKTIALANSLVKLVQGYKTSSTGTFAGSLDKALTRQFTMLKGVAGLQAGQFSLFRAIRASLSTMLSSSSEEVKKNAISSIQLFLKERVEFNISELNFSFLPSFSTFIVMGESDSIFTIVSTLKLRSHPNLRRIVVVESNPLSTSSLSLVEQFVQLGIEVKYTSLSGVALFAHDACVLIGATAVLGSGDIISYSGSSMVSAVAMKNQIPVFAIAQTYLFSSTVISDHFYLNSKNNYTPLESNDEKKKTKASKPSKGEKVIVEYKESSLFEVEKLSTQNILSLQFDVLDSVSGIITEFGFIRSDKISEAVREVFSFEASNTHEESDNEDD